MKLRKVDIQIRIKEESEEHIPMVEAILVDHESGAIHGGVDRPLDRAAIKETIDIAVDGWLEAILRDYLI